MLNKRVNFEIIDFFYYFFNKKDVFFIFKSVEIEFKFKFNLYLLKQILNGN